jgi:outer membrane protein TolC
MLLLQNQMNQAQLNEDTYGKQYLVALQRLGLIIGLQATSIQVPDATQVSEDSLSDIQDSSDNPFLNLANDEVQAAKAQSDSASAERLPRLYVSGSVGLMDDSRLVSQNDYSGWVGVSVPLFEGFRIDSEEKKNQALYRERTHEVSAVRLKVADVNAQLDQVVQVARDQLAVLGPQHDAALKSFSLAKDRYLNFLGSVTDLEESVRNVAQIETEIQNAQMDLLTAMGARKLFNGGVVKATGAEPMKEGKK